MPRKSKGTYLYLHPKERVWIIRDRGKFIRTGCSVEDVERAEILKSEYIARKHSPPAKQINPECQKVILFYAELKAPAMVAEKRKRELLAQCTRLVTFFTGKTFSQINGELCRAYRDWSSTDSMARRDLETFRAAIRSYAKEYNIPAVPGITLPPKGQARETHLTRQQAAKLVLAAWRAGHKHLVRFILIGLYTGTRSEAIKEMQWMPNTEGGHFDLEKGIMYRAHAAHKATRKRREPCPIPNRLMAWLRRWKAQDSAGNAVIRHCVHYRGRKCGDVKKSFASAVKDSGLPKEVTPHILRHTAISWAMADGKQLASVSKFFNVSLKVLEAVYWHTHPDYLQEMRR